MRPPGGVRVECVGCCDALWVAKHTTQAVSCCEPPGSRTPPKLSGPPAPLPSFFGPSLVGRFRGPMVSALARRAHLFHPPSLPRTLTLRWSWDSLFAFCRSIPTPNLGCSSSNDVLIMTTSTLTTRTMPLIQSSVCAQSAPPTRLLRSRYAQRRGPVAGGPCSTSGP